MKKKISIVLAISVFFLCFVGSVIIFFRNSNENKPAISISHPDTATSSKYSSKQNEDFSKLQEENDKLKKENDKLQKDYDDLKNSYDALSQKYYEAVPTAFFTFDDGPSANTEKILEILRNNNIKATFFVIGTETPFRTQMYKKIADEGHAVGIHTYIHDYKAIYKSEDAFLNDLNQIENSVKAAIGYTPHLYRFPGGSNNSFLDPELFDVLVRDLKVKGYEFFDWNVASGDTASVTPSKDFIVNNVVSGCRARLKQKNKNAVILFHDAPAKKTTPLALEEIIPALKTMGYKFEPLTKDACTVHFHIKYKKPVE